MKVVNCLIIPAILLSVASRAQQLAGLSGGTIFQGRAYGRGPTFGVDYFAEVEYVAFKIRGAIEPETNLGLRRQVLGMVGLTSEVDALASFHVMFGYNNMKVEKKPEVAGMVVNSGVFCNPTKSNRFLLGLDVYAWPQFLNNTSYASSEAALAMVFSVNYKFTASKQKSKKEERSKN